MARDRQRRRRAQQGKDGARQPDDATTPNGGDDDLSREIGTDDATIDRGALGEGTPAPDPLKNAMPDVDQAHLAEAGSGRGESGDVPNEVDHDVEYLPAPDEVEGDQAIRRGDLDPSVAEEVAPARRERGRVVAFLGHCVDELRRVRWPDRKQVFQATAVVLGFVVLAGGYLGLMDAIFKPLVQAIL